MHHNYIIFLSKTCNFFTDYSAPPFAYMAVAKACQLPQFRTQTHTHFHMHSAVDLPNSTVWT